MCVKEIDLLKTVFVCIVDLLLFFVVVVVCFLLFLGGGGSRRKKSLPFSNRLKRSKEKLVID